MIRNLDTSLLRAFVAVAETAGMTSAANVLHLTQAAVSQQIKRLEDAFGCELFERDRRGLRLTAAGERLLGRAKRMLALNDEIWAEMTTPDFSGEVRLGIPTDIVHAYLPPVLKRFARAYPRVRIVLDCRSSFELREALIAGLLDLAITTELTCGPGGETLFLDKLVWVGARGGEACRERPLPVAAGHSTCSFRSAVTKALQNAGLEWRAVSEVNDTGAMSAMVQADLAVMALLASTVPGDFEVVGPESGLPALPAFSVNLYLSRSEASSATREFARHLREDLSTRTRQVA
jgi:DNA-binding transcriptional LysR family regulator